MLRKSRRMGRSGGGFVGGSLAATLEDVKSSAVMDCGRVVLHSYNEKTNTWVGDGEPGSYLVVERNNKPFYCLVFVGQQGPLTLVVNADWTVKCDDKFLYLREHAGGDTKVFRFETREGATRCERVLTRLVANARDTITVVNDKMVGDLLRLTMNMA